MRFLGAADVLQRGFYLCHGLPSRNFDRQEPTKHDIKLFKKHYGSDPAVLARMWHDMGETILLETGKTIIHDNKDKTEKGFKSFLIATHFIWAYPKNGEMLASRFGVGLRQVQGENLWRWVQMIALLKEKKFVWPGQIYNDPNGQIYIVSVDGVDFKVWEMKHPTMPRDKGAYANVAFEQFKDRLRDHRKQVNENKIRAAKDLKALAHDRCLFPRRLVNDRGQLVFDLHPAKLLLRADVIAGKHLRMTPRELQMTSVSYQMFEPDIFRQRIYQEVRYSKFVNYLKERRTKGLF